MIEKLTEIFPEDAAFFRGLIDSRERLDNLRIYSDWLEQMNDPLRAEIVRIQIEMANSFPGSHQYHDLVEDRDELVQKLHKQFQHSKHWLAAIGFGAIEGCVIARRCSPCPRRWENLPLANDDPAARLCHLCNKIIRYCESLKEAKRFYQSGYPVTVDPIVKRKISDLETENFE